METKHLEPTLLFSEEHINIGTEEKPEDITVAELVKKNQILLSWPTDEDSAPQDIPKRPIHAGRNTYLSEDGETIIASLIGYPRVDSMKQENSDSSVLLLSIDPFVRITDETMRATLFLQQAPSDVTTPRNEVLLELLKEADICFGIDEEALLKAQDILQQGCDDFHEIHIATGKPSQPGTDEYLQFAFEIGPIAGKLLKDGSIDFRERKIMIAVSKDQLLATRMPAIPGIPGMNVMGQEIEPEGGKEIDFKIIDDTSFSEESGEIRATKDGILTVVNDSHIRVCAKQVIEGDVDYETGNIVSKNCVTINGAVQPGFKVSTAGDLEIQKEVMSATLHSESNIVIKGGITGNKTTINADGDIDILFIEQGKITAGCNVIIRKQTYYSDVAAGGDIRYQAGSKLIGGDIIAGGQLSVANVGSDNCKPSLLAAGVDIERLHLYNELKNSLAKQQDDIIKWLQRYGGSAKSKKIRKMEQQVDETKMKLLKLNVIPGSLTYSRIGNLRDMQEETDDSIETKFLDIAKIFIDIHGTIFGGTELRVGNVSMILSKTVSNRRIKLSNNLKRLIATPLTGRT